MNLLCWENTPCRSHRFCKEPEGRSQGRDRRHDGKDRWQMTGLWLTQASMTPS